MQPPVVVPVEMIGRQRERAELIAALADTLRGRGRAALVLGEAGMGKSMLADWLVTQAATAGLRPGRGYCSTAGMRPLWPWRRALDAMGLAPPWPMEGADPTSSARELVAAAVVETLAAASRTQPLLIVLEDLHWADPASLLVVRAVADAVAALPVMMLLTSRDDSHDTAADILDLLADLPTGVRRVTLAPLEFDEVAELAKGSLGYGLSDRAARDLHTRTGGNPFFVHEVSRLLASRGPTAALVVPPGVREVLSRRLARLGQPCASLLTAAAITAETAADAIEIGLLCAVVQKDEGTVTLLLDEAVGARLVDVDAVGTARYRFRHTLVREVLGQGLSAIDRGRLHGRVAQELENRPAGSTDAPRLAYHWWRASGTGARQRAAGWSLHAARDALAEFGFEAAAGHYADALTEASTDRVAVLIEHGEALQLAGDVTAARAALLAAAKEASAASRPVDLARAALALGGGLAGFEVPIHDDDQADLLRRADATLPAAEIALRAAVRGRLSLARAGTASLAERVELAKDAVRMACDAADDHVESAVLAAYCDAIAGPDFVGERIAAGTRMLDLAAGTSGSEPRKHTTELLARRLLLVAFLEQGDFAAADQQAAAYERVARRMHIPRYAWLPEIWRAMHVLLDGNPDLALRHADAAEEIGRRAGSLNAELMAFTVRMQAHLDRGTAAEFADDVNALLTMLGPAGMPAMYYATPARVLLAAGADARARAVLRAFLTGTAESMPADAEWLEAHWAMVDMAIALDDRRAAAGLFRALRPYENLWAIDGIGGVVFGTVAEQLGRLAGYLGRPAEADLYLGDARERYDRAGVVGLRRRIDALTPPRPADESASIGRIRREGQFWLVEWRGRRSMIADSKGLRDLAVLLARPGRAVPAMELVEAAGGPPAASAGADLGPILDERARQAYRHRLAELDRDLDEVTADADLARAERLRTERSMLVDELAGAFGLGGRPRISGDPADRARKAVTMRIRATIGAIGRQDEALGRHLQVTVRTGRVCSYQPDSPVSWQT